MENGNNDNGSGDKEEKKKETPEEKWYRKHGQSALTMEHG